MRHIRVDYDRRKEMPHPEAAVSPGSIFDLHPRERYGPYVVRSEQREDVVCNKLIHGAERGLSRSVGRFEEHEDGAFLAAGDVAGGYDHSLSFKRAYGGDLL